jgi:hypothetical protein
MSIIQSVAELEAIYGQPNLASTAKATDRVTAPYRTLIEATEPVSCACTMKRP